MTPITVETEIFPIGSDSIFEKKIDTDLLSIKLSQHSFGNYLYSLLIMILPIKTISVRI
jgi:hypothetical protein